LVGLVGVELHRIIKGEAIVRTMENARDKKDDQGDANRDEAKPNPQTELRPRTTGRAAKPAYRMRAKHFFQACRDLSDYLGGASDIRPWSDLPTMRTE
jgi:hypothetical protein